MTLVDDAELMSGWTAGRVVDLAGGEVDGELIRRFCTASASDVDPRGIHLRHATVTGELDLAGVTVAFPLRFDACAFHSPPVFYGAGAFELAIVDSNLPGLLANGVRLQRDLDLSRSRVGGSFQQEPPYGRFAAIWLSEAQIGGRLLFRGTTIGPERGRAVYADRIRVGGSVRFIDGFTAQRGIRLIGARIDGSLDLVGVRIDTDAGALDLSDAYVGESVYLTTDEQTGSGPRMRGTVDLSNARIVGQLLIRDAQLTRPSAGVTSSYRTAHGRAVAVAAARLQAAAIALEGVTAVDGAIDLSSAQLGGLVVDPECELHAPGDTALDLTNAELRSSLRLDGVTVEGSLQLNGIRLRGSLKLTRADLSRPAGEFLLSADGAEIDGDVDLHHLRATGGELKFWRSAVKAGLDATGAVLDNPAGRTIRLHQSSVGGSVRLVHGFTSTGFVMLNRSIIEGRLDCLDATLRCPEPSDWNRRRDALQAISTTIRGGIALGWRQVEPSVDFTDATCSVLDDDPVTWPPEFSISGFTYERFGALRSGGRLWDWEARRAWLRRQASFDAGPYEQAARVFRQHGYAYGAEQLLIAQRADARRPDGSRSRWWRRGLDSAYGVTLGYGFRPGRALWLLVALLALVSLSLFVPAAQSAMRASDQAGVVYTPAGRVGAAADEPPCGNGRVRCFHPVLYAIDTVVPLVSLEQRSTWYPDPNVADGTVLEWWLNLATVAGWLLSSIFLLSFARMARSA